MKVNDKHKCVRTKAGEEKNKEKKCVVENKYFVRKPNPMNQSSKKFVEEFKKSLSESKLNNSM